MPSGPLPRSRPHRVALALAALLLATLTGALAGCGSSPATGTVADPAVAVPASAAVYVGATVRPSGAEATAALAAGRALTHQADPYLRLVQALQTPGAPALSFKRDVAPWLGPHAAIFLSSLSSSSSLLTLLQQGLLGGSSSVSFPFDSAGVQGAIVLDTSNEAKARSFLNGEARHAGARPAAYRGVSYQATAGGIAFAVVDRFAVIGSESAVHSVIDTTLGGASLAHAGGYTKLLASAPPGALAHIYTNPTGSQQGPAEQGLGGALALLTGAREANVSLVPSASSVALDADTLGSGPSSAPGDLLSTGGQGARTLGELPGESWLAIGLGDVGSTLSTDVQGLRGLLSVAGGASSEGAASGTLNLKGLLEGLFTPLGALGASTAQARHDFQSWMGSAGIFASGGSLLELKGGVVIESTDPALSRAAVSELGAELSKMGGSVQPASIAGTEAALSARLPGLPVALAIADGRSSGGQAKFVLGLGEASVPQALDPPSTLSAAASYGAAGSALGEGIQPSIVFDVPTFLTLLEGVGLTEDPTISKFVPYLRTLTTIEGGGHGLGGGVERYRLVLGVNPASG